MGEGEKRRVEKGGRDEAGEGLPKPPDPNRSEPGAGSDEARPRPEPGRPESILSKGSAPYPTGNA